MNLRSLILILLLLVAAGCRPAGYEALRELDRELAREKEYIREKEEVIDGLRDELARIRDPRARHRVLDLLYKQYAHYDADSAFYYAHAKRDLALTLRDRALINADALDLAQRYLLSGKYVAAEEELDESEVRDARLLYSLYQGLRITHKDPVKQEHYRYLEQYYRQICLEELPGDKPDYYFMHASALIQDGDAHRARELLEGYLRKGQLSDAEMGSVHYWLALACRKEGRADLELEHFCTAAGYDLRSCRRGSRSLVQAARIALRGGQTRRAYRYISRAYDEAVVADARICLEDVSRFMPGITSAYERAERHRRLELFAILGLLGVMFAGSLGALLYTQRLHGQLVKAGENREKFMGRYISLFSEHIDSLERYRSTLRRTAKNTDDLQEVRQALRSDAFINAERETMYENFDRTFLAAFPHFVQQLNALLQDGKHIGGHLPAGHLTNELRIFALIRMGVTESAKIAQFLQIKPSTVYNYRVKLRNAAICPHEEFENQLMQIGRG